MTDLMIMNGERERGDKYQFQVPVCVWINITCNYFIYIYIRRTRVTHGNLNDFLKSNLEMSWQPPLIILN